MRFLLTKAYRSEQLIALILLSVVFFALYSLFPYTTTRDGAYFASPDATANYFWAARFARGEPLQYFEPLNLIADDAVVPRSVRSDNGTVKPVSFLGIILIYGLIAKITGLWIVPFLTPLLAVIGVLCFYGIIKKVFDEKVAFWSALMLLCLAPYWYYSARGMFHNVLFADFVLLSVYLFIVDSNYKKTVVAVLSGVALGLAVSVRVSELIWLVPAGLLTAIVYFKKIPLRKALLFICGLVLALVPMLYYNNVLYGGYFNFGYEHELNRDVADATVETGHALSLQTATDDILPFGLDVRNAARNFLNYYVYIFWYLFWPALFGGALFLYEWKKLDKGKKIYFIHFILVSVILGVFYGSWSIQDSIAQNSITIGSSYTRYWLPMYIMSMPLAIVFVQRLTRKLRTDRPRRSGGVFAICLAALLYVAFLFFNFQTAVFGADEGLYYTAQGIFKNKKLTAQVLSHVEDNAVVVSENLDKYIWPERKVMALNIFEAKTHEYINSLVEYGAPVYYYGFVLQASHKDLLNSERMKKFNLKIESVEIYYEHKLGLYKIIKNNE